jgi:hypothetical protein
MYEESIFARKLRFHRRELLELNLIMANGEEEKRPDGCICENAARIDSLWLDTQENEGTTVTLVSPIDSYSLPTHNSHLAALAS